MGSKVTPIENSKFHIKWRNQLYWADCLMVISIVAFIAIFCVHQPLFQIANSIDTSKWGSFGDFIGGLLGTTCAYISVRILVKTLKEQKVANDYLKSTLERSSEVYELQLLHENLSTLLESYHRAKETYVYSNGDKKGDAALKCISDDMSTRQISTTNSLIDRIDEARKLFESQYIQYRETMSVHYRLLYQIFQLIWQSKIKDDKKVILAKMLRSQFSEHELLLLRYNCVTSNGIKMQLFVNQFNLLKHLPLSHLLEFKPLITDLDSIEKNRLDTECLILRKSIKDLLLRENNKDETQNFNYSDRYKGILTIYKEKRECKFELIKNTRKAANSDPTSMDRVFEKWNDTQIKTFYVDYFSYIFDFSNFSQFNKLSDLTIDKDIKTEDSGKKHTIWAVVKKSNSRLVISMSQILDPQ